MEIGVGSENCWCEWAAAAYETSERSNPLAKQLLKTCIPKLRESHASLNTLSEYACRKISQPRIAMKSVGDSPLPGGSRQEDLEVLSRNHVCPLFDPERFVLSQQTTDNGVDILGEIKEQGSKTGIAFKLQLKAKDDGKRLTDGSYSKSIPTSNLNYLWNQGVPAFYVLYVEEVKEAYYCYLTPTIKKLTEEMPDWEDQKSHSIRFTDKLDASAIDTLYQIILEHGQMLREMRHRLASISAIRDNNEKVMVGADLSVVDDGVVGRTIERFGLWLCNEGRWLEVIDKHLQGSRSARRSGLYHLIVAQAYYYTGQLVEAMSLLKLTLAQQDELPSDLKGMLSYFNAVVRLSSGSFSKEEYEEEIARIPNQDPVAQYLRLERMEAEYANGLASDFERAFAVFSDNVSSLLAEADSTGNLKLLGLGEVLRFEGCRNNTRYARAMANARALEEAFNRDFGERAVIHQAAVKVNLEWAQRVDELKKSASIAGNQSALFTTAFYEAKVLLEFDVIRCLFGGGQKTATSIALMDQLLANFGEAYKFFSRRDFRDNMIATLSLRFEVLSYLGRDTASTVQELKAIVEQGESREDKQKLKLLLEGGTTHESYQRMIDEAQQAAFVARAEWESLVREMGTLDKSEGLRSAPNAEEHVIELYPIGHFIVPSSRIREAYEVLGVSEDARGTFETIWALPAIPVANIFNARIDAQGYAHGQLDDRGIESWRNIHRVRTAFHEKKFPRIQLHESEVSFA